VVKAAVKILFNGKRIQEQHLHGRGAIKYSQSSGQRIYYRKGSRLNQRPAQYIKQFLKIVGMSAKNPN